MTHDIFISYRRHDSSSFAARLRDRLERTFPDQVFLDVSGIEIGDDFVERLRSAVLSAKVLVAVIGPGWALNRAGRPSLGDGGDVVTEEIATALEAGIPVIPVLMEGTPMPLDADLPARLKALHRRNAVSISHARFDSDVNHLITAIYRPLGISPPSRLERMLEAGSRAGFSQRTRDQFAVIAAVAAALGVLIAASWILVNRSDPLESSATLVVSGLALVLALIGRNSIRRRRLATAAIVMSGTTLATALVLGAWRGFSLPRDPWFEAIQIAQAHVNRPELPSDQILWTTRAPFNVPLPSVDCQCLAMAEPSSRSLPHPADASVTFTNGCSGPVTLALSRSRTAMLANVYPWFPASGRDFAVVTLGPGQVVRVPMGGTFGGAFQPWICQKDLRTPSP